MAQDRPTRPRAGCCASRLHALQALPCQALGLAQAPEAVAQLQEQLAFKEGV